jgi:hypothetical protein
MNAKTKKTAAAETTTEKKDKLTPKQKEALRAMMSTGGFGDSDQDLCAAEGITYVNNTTLQSLIERKLVRMTGTKNGMRLEVSPRGLDAIGWGDVAEAKRQTDDAKEAEAAAQAELTRAADVATVTIEEPVAEPAPEPAADEAAPVAASEPEPAIEVVTFVAPAAANEAPPKAAEAKPAEDIAFGKFGGDPTHPESVITKHGVEVGKVIAVYADQRPAGATAAKMRVIKYVVEAKGSVTEVGVEGGDWRTALKAAKNSAIAQLQ